MRGSRSSIRLVLNMRGVPIDVGHEIPGASLVHEPVRVRGEPLPAGFSAPSVAQADATSLSRCGQQAEFLSGREPP